MIGRIRGVLVEKRPPDVLVEAMGVGYEIQMPMTSIYPLPDVGNEVVIYTHFVVREDAQLLFGFVDKTERATFRELIKANGVGPKLALTILSGMSAAQLAHVVHNGDVAALVKLPGVGKKTAERLLVEMRDKLKDIGTEAAVDMSGLALQDGASEPLLQATPGVKEEASSALQALGYKAAQAEKMIKAVYDDSYSCEQLIREALRAVA